MATGNIVQSTLPLDYSASSSRNPSLALYLACLSVSILGIMAFGLAGSDTGIFTSTLVAITIAGTGTSYIVRKYGASSPTIESIGTLICVLLAAPSLLSIQVLPLMPVPDMAAGRMQTIGVTLVWLIALRSFVLLSDSGALFSLVPALALFGLVGQLTHDPALETYFALFVLAGAFVMVHHHFLSARGTPSGTGTSFLPNQTVAAAVCFAAALLLGRIVQPGLENLVSYLPFAAGALNADRSALPTVPPKVTIAEDVEVPVGVGPTTNSDEVVMRVQSEVGAYWRGATFDEYTGHSWRNSHTGTTDLQTSQPKTSLADALSDTQPEARNLVAYTVPVSGFNFVGPGNNKLVQRVYMEGHGSFSELYSAAEPQTIRIASARAKTDQSGVIKLSSPISNAYYEVDSLVPDSRPDRLSRVRLPAPPDIATVYAQYNLVSSAQTQLADSARQMVRGLSTEYQRVEALKHFVEQRCSYNSQAPAVPNGMDVASYFLFTSRQGDCTCFATALALLCRAVGIPARVASGFIPGTFDPVGQQYLVKAADKHLWTEVYYTGIGWITVDATEDAADVSAVQKLRKSTGHSLWQQIIGAGLVPAIMLVGIALALGYILVSEIQARRTKRGAPAWSLYSSPQYNQQIIKVYLLACRALASKGYAKRAPTMTPEEYLAQVQVSQVQQEVCLQFERLTDLAVTARYCGMPLSAVHARNAEQYLAAIKEIPKRQRALASTAADQVTSSV